MKKFQSPVQVPKIELYSVYTGLWKYYDLGHLKAFSRVSKNLKMLSRIYSKLGSTEKKKKMWIRMDHCPQETSCFSITQ